MIRFVAALFLGGICVSGILGTAYYIAAVFFKDETDESADIVFKMFLITMGIAVALIASWAIGDTFIGLSLGEKL